MDFALSRRPGATYGKAVKRVVVHDLFDYRSTADSVSRSKAAAVEPIPASTKLIQATPESAYREQDPLDSASSPGPPFSSPTSVASDEGSSRDNNTGKVQDDHMFDLNSSSDEAHARQNESQSRKRRLVRPLSGRSGPILLAAKSSTTTSSPSHRIADTTRRNKSKPVTERSYGFDVRRPVGAAKQSLRSRESSQNQMLIDPRPSKNWPPPRKDLHCQRVSNPRGQPLTSDEHIHTDASGHLTDHSVQSTQSTRSTPKRKRPLSQHSDASVSSPSSIGFTSLNLTPEQKHPARRPILASATSSSGDDETPRKVRSRLIDRLDAPVHNTDGRSREVSPLLEETSAITAGRGRSSRSEGPKASSLQTLGIPPPSQMPTSEAAQVVQPKATYASKARTTYAKERSHLSDMVDSLDSLGGLSSQQSNQGAIPILPSSTDLGLQLELERDDSDDQSGPGKLKSIHELRRAGANNRFDREIQGLLEDIETEGNATKTLRLQAQIKLIGRLEEESFLRHLVDSGRVSRLVHRGSRMTDVPNATMLVATLLSLMPDAPSSCVTQILDTAVKLTPMLLVDDRSLSKVVSDRKQNFSKSTVRDIMAFEESFVRHKLPSELHVDALYPQHIALHLLNEALRRSLFLGHRALRMSKNCYVAILASVERNAPRLETHVNTCVNAELIKSATRLLEACSLVFDEASLQATDEQYHALGTAFATVMTWAQEEHHELMQDVLRTIVSLSNNQPRVCRVLGHSHVLDSIFHVVDRQFPSVVDQAEAQHQLDQAKLDSVILALGCLLNFAECDGDIRVQLTGRSRAGYSYSERLVSIFNSQVSKVQEATTDEESQVLVAFGYLSMVLCTMSLDVTVRSQITRLLRHQSFTELCTAAETFFSHLRTLENISEEDASMSAFTARFHAILETIRAPVP